MEDDLTIEKKEILNIIIIIITLFLIQDSQKRTFYRK